MDIAVDSVWASPTMLHMRVLIWVGPDKYQKKFYAAVPLADIEPPLAVADFSEHKPDPVDDPDMTLW